VNCNIGEENGSVLNAAGGSNDFEYVFKPENDSYEIGSFYLKQYNS
jgi:hypothetical protein